MQSPYTYAPLDAIMAAQSAVGATLTAVALHRPRRPAVATAALIAAIWLAVLVLVLGDFVRSFGITLETTFDTKILHTSCVLAALSMFTIRRKILLLYVGTGAAAVFA